MNLVMGEIFILAFWRPTVRKTGLSFLPNRVKAARDCQISITRSRQALVPRYVQAHLLPQACFFSRLKSVGHFSHIWRVTSHREIQ
jgi:hypothetical protein